jgi:hypothetical protein
LHQPPWSFEFDSQTRGTRENRAPPCVKVPGSSRVPCIRYCSNKQIPMWRPAIISNGAAMWRSDIISRIRPGAGAWSLTSASPMTGLGQANCHVQQNGSLSHPQDIDAPLRIAAQRKIAAYRQQYADNQNISFLPAIVSTSTRMQSPESRSDQALKEPGPCLRADLND